MDEEDDEQCFYIKHVFSGLYLGIVKENLSLVDLSNNLTYKMLD
jgi:hypothetical protein